MTHQWQAMLRHQRYQAAEVEWYRQHGAHPDRIATDAAGQPYVIGNTDWNRLHPNRPEHVDERMGVAAMSALRAKEDV